MIDWEKKRIYDDDHYRLYIEVDAVKDYVKLCQYLQFQGIKSYNVYNLYGSAFMVYALVADGS